MNYGSTPNVPPPAYDEEANRPFLGSNDDDDMYKEIVANSSKEVRLRKYGLNCKKSQNSNLDYV
jgi:hypothetical protein